MLEQVCQLARNAGDAIMQVYDGAKPMEYARKQGEVRQHWQRYWLVDPLDGTKEFIKRNGEFTVNIALIEQGKPVLGVVYAPVLKVMYYAAEGKAWKEECGVRKQIRRWW